MPANQQLVDTFVQRAIREFRQNPVARNLLRRLAEELPDQFFISALSHLEAQGVSEADRLLAVLLMRRNGLFEFIADPLLTTRERATRLAARLLQSEPAFDLCLARKLPDRSGLNHKEAFTGFRATRVLDVLDEVSSSRRLLPVLYHLMDSQDAKLSARATLFVGRRVRTPDWAGKQLLKADHRVRANAVESIWGVDQPDAIALLESCTNDVNNRVVGNALMGLYILERPGVDKMIPALTIHAKPEFRSTAAWMMGRLARPEFVPDLKNLLRDESPMVRGSALRALVGIRKAEGTVPEAILTLEPESPIPLALAAESAEVEDETPTPPVAENTLDLLLDGSFPLRTPARARATG